MDGVKLDDRLDACLRDAVARTGGRAPGALAVDAPGLGVSFRSGRGGEPFRIASITKPFTATAVHRLAEDGRLALAESIGAHLSPETAGLLADGGYDSRAISLAALLSHTSGIPDHAETVEFARAVAAAPGRRWSRREQISVAAGGHVLVRPAGTVSRLGSSGWASTRLGGRTDGRLRPRRRPWRLNGTRGRTHARGTRPSTFSAVAASCRP